MGRHFFTFMLAAFIGLLAGPASAGTITVGWDLMDNPDVTGYRVFVGTSPGNYSQSFDVPAEQDFYIFRSAFMGVRYYFAVAAELNGSEIGPRSGEVTTVGTRTMSGTAPERLRVGGPSACNEDCYVVDELARDLGEISGLAVAHDGSIFAVESGRRVIVVRGGTVVTAFEAEPGTILRDLALDPQFAVTGRVFVSLVRRHDRPGGELEVLRLRSVNGRLGEPATVFGGVDVPLTAAAALAAGDDGLVYLALPALLSRHPYSSSVLAFDQDGRVPAGQRSLVIARGFEDPADLGWDAEARLVWLFGRNGGGEMQLLPVSTLGAGTALFNVVGPGESGAALAVGAGSVRRVLLAAGVDLLESTPGSPDSLRISLEEYGTPVAVAVSGGARYVATRSNGDGRTSRLVRVEAGHGDAR